MLCGQSLHFLLNFLLTMAIYVNEARNRKKQILLTLHNNVANISFSSCST